MATPSKRQVGYQQEPDDHRTSEPLDMDADGEAESVVSQDATGAETVRGSVEFPDPDRPPEPPAPGAS
jgi:hypothetical protein